MIIFPVLSLLLVAEILLRAYHGRRRNAALPAQLRAETRTITWKDVQGKYRIICLGDSITYGESLPSGKDYPSVLASLLRQRHPALDTVVINSGIGGNTSVQGVARLKRDALWYRPHVVIASFGLNDGNIGHWPLDPIRERRLRGDLKNWERLDALLRHSHIYLTVRGRTRRLLRRLGWINGPIEVRTDGPPKPRVSHDGFALALEQLVQRLQAAGCKAVFLATMTPVGDAFHEELGPVVQQRQFETYQAYNRLICSATDSNGAHLLDLHSMLAPYSRDELQQPSPTEAHRSLVMDDGVHLTAEGERVVAQTVLQALEDAGLPGSEPYHRR
jgi:lysophospholipase L1-like esterase